MKWAHPLRAPKVPFLWRGLKFENRLGIAGGVDKNGDHLNAWWSYGCGFVEVGTVTPRPQTANPGPILARNLDHDAVWNKMGFPNKGAIYVAGQLKALGKARPTPIFLNIGKNRETKNTEATRDYLQLIQAFEDFADVFVINISSPNTQGLRELFQPLFLSPFLSTLRSATAKPMLLKLSPDLPEDSFKAVLDTSLTNGLDGWIISNTTTARELSPRTQQPYFDVAGGVSGRPLADRSRSLLKSAVAHLGNRRGDRLLVSAGGVLTPDDVFERLALGADLVQVYSTLIFSGPGFFKQVADKAEKP